MFKIILVTPEHDNLSTLAEALKLDPRVQIVWARSGAEAVEIASNASPELIIIDQQINDITGLELVYDLMMVNAQINTAVVSHLAEEEFETVSEGLGILAQLPPHPGSSEAEMLISRLAQLGA